MASKTDIIMCLVQGMHPAELSDAKRARTLEAYRRYASDYYKTHTHQVRRRQLLYNLNSGRTRFPSRRSIQAYQLRYLATEDRWV